MKVNKKYTSITKITCKDFYWHIIDKQKHTPTNIKKWCTIYTGFNDAEVSIWNRTFKIAFQICRDTKQQSFQYRIIHRIIPSNKWLKDRKIKDSSVCNFCDKCNDLQHFFLFCSKTHEFGNYWANWWKKRTNFNIKNHINLEECIIFGFPNNDDSTKVFNDCILLAKYHIYIQKLKAMIILTCMPTWPI